MFDQPPTASLPAKPGPIEPRLKDHEERIAKLERMVKELSDQLKAQEKR